MPFSLCFRSERSESAASVPAERGEKGHHFMLIDFEFVLVVATLVCGLIWLTDIVFFRRPRRARSLEATGGENAKALPEPLLVDYARSFFPVLLIVLILRSFIAEPFRIPSESMLPTLQVGDFILVNKYAYGVRMPVTRTEVLQSGRPERGEVAVFRYPRDPSMNYIKRIVGLPGDTIELNGHQLLINGRAVQLQPVGTYDAPPSHGAPEGLVVYSERLGDDEHTIILDPRRRSRNGEFTVPDGHYFALGDNRDYSNDSRHWGYVPEDHLVGRARRIWMNWNWDDGGVDWSRLGTAIR